MIRTYDISLHGPSVTLNVIGGSPYWEENSRYRYTYHKEAGLWSDWFNMSIEEINNKTFRDSQVDIEIESEGDAIEDFPAIEVSLPDDKVCELPTIAINDNTIDGDPDSEPCTASIKTIECEDADAVFNPYATGSASELYNELSSIVSDTFGFTTRYFRTSPVRNSADYIFHEYSLKNVSASNNVKVLVEDNNLPSRSFAINNPLLDYQETLTVHIVKDEFHSKFGSKAYPREHDYLAFNMKNFNKMFEVIGVYQPDDFLYASSYWIVLLQPYQERSMIGIDGNDPEVVKDREGAEETESKTLNIDDGDLTKEIETFTFNQKQEDHIKAAKEDTEKARGDSLLNDKILDNSRKRSDFIADTYDSAIKCQKEILYHMNIPVASYNYKVRGKGVGNCAILYHKHKNEPICRISFIYKLMSTVTRPMPVISDGNISVWITRKTISVKKDNNVKTFTMSDPVTNKWCVASIIMDEDDFSMTRVSVWGQERDDLHSRDKFTPIIAEGYSRDDLDKAYPLLNDAEYGEVCLFGGPYCITNIKLATDPLPADKEFSAAIVQVSQDMQNMIVSDMAQPRITSESIMPLVKHPDEHEKAPVSVYKLSLSVEPADSGNTTGSGTYEKGTTVNIAASSSIGYVFVSWSDGDTNKEKAITMDSDISLTAIFAAEDPVAKPDGVLPGIFSVSDDKKVKFSQGNLLFCPSEMTWALASEQYNYIGGDNSSISSDFAGHIDLYGWGSTGIDNGSVSWQPWSVSEDDKDYYINNDPDKDIDNDIDWGYNRISNGGDAEGLWFTLSMKEWEYLYSGRENAASLRTRACIDGTNGYVFFPDDWVCPENIDVVIDTAKYTNNIWSVVIWNLLEKSGAVFLPAGGDRDGIDVDEVNSYGDYWSSTHCNDKYAYCFTFNKGREFVYYANRHGGHCVRLVTSRI